MGLNILITGAAGYIGGTILADFVSRTTGPIKTATISAAVRTDEQAGKLTKLGIKVIQVELSDKTSVIHAILDNEIDIVLHLASSMDPRLASYLIEALGQRRKAGGKEVYFIHSSVTALFDVENGWPYGEIKDTDSTIFEKERQLEIKESNPVRETNVLVVQQSKEHNVSSLIVVVPFVYGRGSGEWRKISSPIPSVVRTSITHKTVYKFDVEGSPAAAHVSDLAALYALITEKILQNKPVPTGERGYYFGMAHRAPWWDIMQRLAKHLHARGLVSDVEVKVWPSDDMAAEYLGWPRQFVRGMGTSRLSGELVAINAHQLGWQPKWDQQRFLESMDDEIQAVLELDTVKQSIYDVLRNKDESKS